MKALFTDDSDGIFGEQLEKGRTGDFAEII